MYVINNNIENEINIKNSRFICLLYKVNNIDIVKDILSSVKEKYPKATHYCYAYIIDNNKKSSDDNEPGGTAGIPILSSLDKNNLTNILCVVVRYFGGIKLGAGGLNRAYTKSVTDALCLVKFNPLVNGYLISIEIDYNELDNINYILNNPMIKEKEFGEKIKLILELDQNQLKLLDDNRYKYKILEEILIEKR